MQAELADALRKRKSRSDASDEDLGLPRSPSTPPRNDHHVIDGNSNSSTGIGIRSNHHHLHSSLGLLSMASSESYDECSQSFLSASKSLYDTSGKIQALGDEFFPGMSLNVNGSSDTKLSHSAAKHKMAVRPKKKGPSRPNRKPVEVEPHSFCAHVQNCFTKKKIVLVSRRHKFCHQHQKSMKSQ